MLKRRRYITIFLLQALAAFLFGSYFHPWFHRHGEGREMEIRLPGAVYQSTSPEEMPDWEVHCPVCAGLPGQCAELPSPLPEIPVGGASTVPLETDFPAAVDTALWHPARAPPFSF